jgi:hypothetical protein
MLANGYDVTELSKASRKVALVLSLVALFVPYEMEFEASGPWDARSFRRLISSVVWKIETNGYQSMVGSWETTDISFSYCCLSEFATLLLLINLILVFLIVLCLDGLISHCITVYILILSAILPPILSALVSPFLIMGDILVIPIPAIHLIGLYLLRNSKSINH